MKFQFKPLRYLPVFVAATGICALVAWNERPQPTDKTIQYQDTVPAKKKPARDLDKDQLTAL